MRFSLSTRDRDTPLLPCETLFLRCCCKTSKNVCDTTAKCRLRIAETGQFHGHKREPFFISFLRRFLPPSSLCVVWRRFCDFPFFNFSKGLCFSPSKKKNNMWRMYVWAVWEWRWRRKGGRGNLENCTNIGINLNVRRRSVNCCQNKILHSIGN